MREKPNPQDNQIVACVNHHYGLQIVSVDFLPIGYDPYASVYAGYRFTAN